MTEAYRTDRTFFVASDTPLPVVEKPSASVVVSGNANTVPPSTLTPVVTYVNAADVLWLDGWSGKGQFDGDWYLEINGSPVHEGNALATNSPGRAYTTPIKVAAGITVRIMVTHYGGSTADFAGTLFGHRQ